MKKGQIFSLDFLAAVFIFIIMLGVLITSWGYVLDKAEQNNERKDMELRTNMLADIFVSSAGKPYNWEDDVANAKTLGLVRIDRIIDDTKLDVFINMDYGEAKNKLQIGGYNFCFILINSGVDKCPFGFGNGLTAFTYRAVVYNDKSDILQFSLWRYV